MWVPRIVDWPRIAELNLEDVICGKTPMAVIRGFYGKQECRAAASKINAHARTSFQDGQLSHIGPFLMAYATNKKKYFKNAAAAQMALGEIFPDAHDPIPRMYDVVGRTLLGYQVSLARESQNSYSPAVIRIHGKGKSVPVHKDNVGYEGREYAISDIDCQLSCILHLQESEGGGRLITYGRRWKKADERFRNVDFGYSPDLVKCARSCRAPAVGAGDLVIINPGYYHEVTEITGCTPRITLGVFMGIYRRDRRVVAWA